jgi:peptidyl-prolyl cis-trans isomerase A (cyclophilin A)
VRGDPRKTFPPIAHEPTSQTGVLHKAGAISLARLAPGTATGTFRSCCPISKGWTPTPIHRSRGAAGYAAFGHVVSGMDVVRRSGINPSIRMRAKAMKGQMLAQPVKVISVRRVAPAPAAP